jgi:hypothetical protein
VTNLQIVSRNANPSRTAYRAPLLPCLPCTVLLAALGAPAQVPAAPAQHTSSAPAPWTIRQGIVICAFTLAGFALLATSLAMMA